MNENKVSFKSSFVGQLTGVEYIDEVGTRTLSGILGSLAHPLLGGFGTYLIRSLAKPGSKGIISRAKGRMG